MIQTHNTSSNKIKAIRAATTIETDSPEDVTMATAEMMEKVVVLNKLPLENIVSIHFTLTADIKSLNPATAVRNTLHWNDIPMICSQEAFIEGGLKHCIRAVVHAYPTHQVIQHVYLNQAKMLREDWRL
jgi:chorismate mutase